MTAVVFQIALPRTTGPIYQQRQAGTERGSLYDNTARRQLRSLTAFTRLFTVIFSCDAVVE